MPIPEYESSMCLYLSIVLSPRFVYRSVGPDGPSCLRIDRSARIFWRCLAGSRRFSSLSVGRCVCVGVVAINIACVNISAHGKRLFASSAQPGANLADSHFGSQLSQQSHEWQSMSRSSMSYRIVQTKNKNRRLLRHNHDWRVSVIVR